MLLSYAVRGATRRKFHGAKRMSPGKCAGFPPSLISPPPATLLLAVAGRARKLIPLRKGTVSAETTRSGSGNGRNTPPGRVLHFAPRLGRCIRVSVAAFAVLAAPIHAGAQAAPDTLRTPAVLRNISTKPHVVEVNIVAAPVRIATVKGYVTSVYAYNGTVPGPTLEAREGDRVIIHFRNELPEATTVHWHGVHLPAVMDGSPLELILPGGHYDYVFTIPPGSAGTYWYHPHPDGRSEFQVAMGLFGAFIVRDPADPIASLPEKVIILSDNTFAPDGSIAFADSTSTQAIIDEENGREGKLLLVNGQLMPTIKIRSGEVQRWRVINASAARVYRLALHGQPMLQVGSDGGLFEHVLETQDVLLANSERVEFLVRGSAAPGSQVDFETLSYDRYMPQTRPADWKISRPLLRLSYTPESAQLPVKIPTTLRVIPALDTGKATVRRTVVLSQGLIDGRKMDMSRADIVTHVGSTEIWDVQNVVGMDHPFHLHGFQFQLLDRNGVPEPYRSWKDVVNIPKHESVRFIVRFADFPGKWMYHCHILAHEDNGMMAILEVR